MSIGFCMLACAASTSAYTIFETQCTSPNTGYNFVSSSPTRGTLDILWSCLFTIFACTWTVQHLNVPEQRDDRDPGFFGDVKWAITRTWASGKWMFWTVLAPEVLISKYIGDVKNVGRIQEKFDRLAKKDEVPWSRTHSFFANMGGFAIRSHVSSKNRTTKDAQACPRVMKPVERPRESLSMSRSGETQPTDVEVSTGREELHEASDTPSQQIENQPSEIYYVNGPDLLLLRNANILDRLPHITKAEIEDRSKTDNLVRSLAIIQILWVSIQTIARGLRHLAVSQLEIAVLAFSVCAITIYVLNWEKPKSVGVAFTIMEYPGDIPNAVREVLGEATWRRGSMYYKIMGDLIGLFRDELLYPQDTANLRISNLSTVSQGLTEVFGLLLGGTLFCSIHVAAWNFTFPTTIERTLWRVSSLTCTGIPCLYIALLILWMIYGIEEGVWISIPSMIYIAIYIAARLFLIVEIFRTLFYLPPTAYVATWATNVPHLA